VTTDAGASLMASGRSIDLQALRNVLEGAEVSSVEATSGELRLILVDGDEIVVRFERSSDPEIGQGLRFFHEPPFSD
jgi:hypothetical protein